MKTLETSLTSEQIANRFYSKVRSEAETDEHSYEQSVLLEDFFYGDIDDDGNFIIKHHSEQSRATRIEPDTFCILGTMTEKEGVTTVEYSYERTDLHIEMWLAWLAVCALILILTFLADILAGAVLFCIMAIAFALYAVSPFEKKRLNRVLRSIMSDK